MINVVGGEFLAFPNCKLTVASGASSPFIYLDSTDRKLLADLSLSLRYPRLRLTKHLGNAAMHFIYSGGFLLGTLPRQ